LEASDAGNISELEMSGCQSRVALTAFGKVSNATLQATGRLIGTGTGTSTSPGTTGTCASPTRDTQEGTVGYRYNFYAGPHGRLRQGFQFR
jgi:hypothetical protein